MSAPEQDTEPAGHDLPPDVVIINGNRLELVVPRSFTLCGEVLRAAVQQQERGFAAALFVCCPRIGRRLAKNRQPLTYEGCGYDPLRLGGEVIDRMHEQGVSHAEVLVAGIKAFNLIADAHLSEEDVKAAEGNSAPPTA